MSYPQQSNGSPAQPAVYQQFSPAPDLNTIPNPQILVSYRKATYADVLNAGDDTYQRVLNSIDWEGRKIPIPGVYPAPAGEVSSSEETDTAEERESSEDGSQFSVEHTKDVWNNLETRYPPGYQRIIQEGGFPQTSYQPIPPALPTPTPTPPIQIQMATRQPTYHVLPSVPMYNVVNTGQTSIFRPNPTPMVYHHPKPIHTLVGGVTPAFQQMSPPPAHQPAVLQPIQNLNHTWHGPMLAAQPQLLPQQNLQMVQQPPVPQQYSGQVLMVYTKPAVNPKPQVMRLVQRNVATAGGTKAGF